LPGQQPEGIKIGGQLEIAEAGLPIGDLESVERVHLEIHREQVAAGVGALPNDRFQKMIRAKALSHQPIEEVRKRNDHGVHLAGADLLLVRS
jgi:hypothetical protein